MNCKAEHEALHLHPLLAPLDKGTITYARYKNIIAMFRMAYDQPERDKGQMSHDLHLPDSPILTWLDGDISRHGIAWQRDESLPRLNVSTLCRLAGYLYVKQGSTLGGQFISQRLRSALQLEPGEDNRFFFGYGTQTGAMWQAFRQKITALEGELSAPEVIASARAAFHHIEISANHVYKAIHETA